jgi:hypothetical protein
VYPTILTTRIRLLERRSQAATFVERSLSVYISDLHFNAVTLVESSNSCPEWEFACAMCLTPSLDALLRGDFSELEDKAGNEETEFDLFAEGEEDDGACFALAGLPH